MDLSTSSQVTQQIYILIPQFDSNLMGCCLLFVIFCPVYSSLCSKQSLPFWARCPCCMASGQVGRLEVGASGSSALAKPLYLQRLERSLRLDGFLRQTADIFNGDITRYVAVNSELQLNRLEDCVAWNQHLLLGKVSVSFLVHYCYYVAALVDTTLVYIPCHRSLKMLRMLL